jgi:hypothetical protein
VSEVTYKLDLKRLPVCDICGALVANVPLHGVWHDQQTDRLRDVAKAARDARATPR